MRSIGRNPTERRQRGSQPDERRIRQGIAQVAGEAVGHFAGLLIHLAAEPILAAVRFIRDDDNVLPRAQLGHRIAITVSFGRRKTSASPREEFASYAIRARRPCMNQVAARQHQTVMFGSCSPRPLFLPR